MRDGVTITESSGDHDGLAGLLLAYHQQTEAEKGGPVEDASALPERYRREVEDPVAAFEGQTVLIATIGETAVGCVVLSEPQAAGREIKRLWTDPAFRGRGIATRLIEAALDRAGDAPVRLTVWHWRAGAIALYERLGFERVDSWESRDGLVCLQRPRPGTRVVTSGHEWSEQVTIRRPK